MAVDILRRCRLNGIPTFFDPGPGNPALDNAWHRQAMAAAQVVLVNEAEAERLTGLADPRAAAPALLSLGPEWAIVKLGGRGCIVQSGAEQVESPAFQVPLVDATGAGDSFAAAVIDGFLRGLPPKDVAVVANATGAAKVQKRGTGRQMPTRDEIRTVLLRGGIPPDKVMRLFP
jgi:sugar/nucleoside kinase (ribokinase family)